MLLLSTERNSPGVVQRERRFRRTSQSMTTGCCWPLLPVRPPRDGAFFVRSPAGVKRRNFTRKCPEASCRLVFHCDISPIFQSRGPVEDDGNGRGRSLDGLGICGHQEALPVRRIVGKEGEPRDSWCRRLSSFCLRSHFLEPIAQHFGTKQKAPGLKPGALAHAA